MGTNPVGLTSEAKCQAQQVAGIKGVTSRLVEGVPLPGHGRVYPKLNIGPSLAEASSIHRSSLLTRHMIFPPPSTDPLPVAKAQTRVESPLL